MRWGAPHLFVCFLPSRSFIFVWVFQPQKCHPPSLRNILSRHIIHRRLLHALQISFCEKGIRVLYWGNFSLCLFTLLCVAPWQKKCNIPPYARMEVHAFRLTPGQVRVRRGEIPYHPCAREGTARRV